MNKFDLKNPRNAYVVIVAILLLAATYFAWDLYWVPYAAEKQSIENRLEKANAELARINVQKNREVKLEKELENAEKEFQRLKDMFPEQEKVPSRLQDLYAVIRASGVQITKFTPTTRNEQEYFIENKYALTLNAGYHMLGYLFAEIANFGYPTSISNLRVMRYGGIDAEIAKSSMHGWVPITTTVTMNLTTYTSKGITQ